MSRHSSIILITVLTTLIGRIQTQSANTNSTQIDICKTQNIKDYQIGYTGYVGIKTNSPSNGIKPCILRIESCASCYLRLQPSGYDWHLGSSTDGLDKLATTECINGRSYLFAFDGHYMEETLKFYTSSGIDGFSHPLNTTSSILYVAYCGTPVDITLKYQVLFKKKTIVSGSGTIRSPFFPLSYVQNGEQFIYEFRSMEGKYITLTFEDWDLKPASEIYFESSNIQSPVSYMDDRPIVQSNGPYMTAVFSTGSNLIGGGERKYLGFKFSYRFHENKQDLQDLPSTSDCGGYIWNSVGGTFEFNKHYIFSGTKHDCVWVVQKKQGYDNVYLKLLTFTGHFGSSVEVRDGLTSDGTLLNTIYNNMTRYRAFTSTVGFYVRLQGHFSREDYTRMSYASYSKVCSAGGHYNCDNLRCISNSLKCDGVDHCGDNSDESKPDCTGGDGSGYTVSSPYHLTVSVIIPMVISVFLLVVLIILFVMIRRCRQERQREMMQNRSIPSVSGRVSRGRSRGRGRNREFVRPADYPPTYEEALVTGTPCPDDSYMGFWQSADGEIPKPPTYEEAITSSPQPLGLSPNLPSSTSSSESGPSNRYHSNGYHGSSYHGNMSVSSPDSSSSEAAPRPVLHSHSMSYSSDSSADVSPDERRFMQRNVIGQIANPPIQESEVLRSSTAGADAALRGPSQQDAPEVRRGEPKLVRRYLNFKDSNIPKENSAKSPMNKFGPSGDSVSVDNNVASHKSDGRKNKRGDVVEGVNGPVSKDGNRKRLHNLMQRLNMETPAEMSARRKLEVTIPKTENEAKPAEDVTGIALGRQQSPPSARSRSNELLFDERHFDNGSRSDGGYYNPGFRHSINLEPDIPVPRNISHSSSAMASSLGNLHEPGDYPNLSSSPTRRVTRSLQQLPTSQESLPSPQRGRSNNAVRQERPLSMSVDNLDRSPRRQPFTQIREDQRSRSCADRDQMIGREERRGRRSSAENLPNSADGMQPGFLNILTDKIDEDVYV